MTLRKSFWGCEPLPNITVSNWGNNTIKLEKGTRIGTVEEVDVVNQDDPLWGDHMGTLATVLRLKEDELKVRQRKLKEQLAIGEVTRDEKESLLHLLCTQHQAFALRIR